MEHAKALCDLAEKLFPPNFGEITQYYSLLGAFYEEIANQGTEKQKRIHLELARDAYNKAVEVVRSIFLFLVF